MSTRCNHNYFRECIEEALQIDSKCPLLVPAGVQLSSRSTRALVCSAQSLRSVKRRMTALVLIVPVPACKSGGHT